MHGFSMTHYEWDFWIKESKELFLLLFDIIIYLKMYMYKLMELSLDHARKKMLEYFDVFSMHTDEESTIRGFDFYIDILFYLMDREMI